MSDVVIEYYGRGGRWIHPPGTMTWEEHVAVWEVYAKRYGSNQSAKRIAARGGFGYGEIVLLTGAPPKTWEPLHG